MRDMPRPRPPHLHREITRHGRTIWYVRVGKGQRVRIRHEYGTPEFEAAYQDAIAGRVRDPRKPMGGTLAWLVSLYRESKAWCDLSHATRRQRENIFRHVLAAAGNHDVASIDRASIKHGQERRKETPAQARHFVDTMRGLFRWALDVELVDNDPTAGIKYGKPKRAGEAMQGFPMWTDDEIAQFERRWPRGTRERVMFDIFLYTGLRRGDAARLGKQHVRNGIIEIDTEKTGTRVTLRILPELAATLKAGPTGDLTYIATADGRGLTKESVGNYFRDACRAAGIRKSAHGLRKAAATRAAEAGATVAQLEAIFGWEGGRMASLYTRAADRRRLAGEAIGKLSRTKKRTSIP